MIHNNWLNYHRCLKSLDLGKDQITVITVPPWHQIGVGLPPHPSLPGHILYQFQGPSWALWDFFIGVVTWEKFGGPTHERHLTEWLVGTLCGGTWLELEPPPDYLRQPCIFRTANADRIRETEGIVGQVSSYHNQGVEEI